MYLTPFCCFLSIPAPLLFCNLMDERRQFFGMQQCRGMIALDDADSFIRRTQLFNVFLLCSAVAVFISLQNINRHFKTGDPAQRETC